MKKALLLLLLLACRHTSFSQTDDEEPIPVFNVVIDDPMDKFGRGITTTVLAPEFYSRNERKVGDTILRYICYNAEHELINLDTTADPYTLQFVSLVQYYTHPAETYNDEKGQKRPLPIEKIIYRYDRIGENGWLTVNYRNNKSSFMKEDIDQIVRTETITTPAGNTVKYEYYKVSAKKQN